MSGRFFNTEKMGQLLVQYFLFYCLVLIRASPPMDRFNHERQSFDNLEVESIEHRGNEILVRTKRDTKIAACRYENVPWSDCDLTNWMRSKTVKLLLDDLSPPGQDCQATRHFSQTCSPDELPEGTRKYLEDQRQMKKKLNYFRMVLQKSKKFLENTNFAMQKANETYFDQLFSKNQLCEGIRERSTEHSRLEEEAKEGLKNCQEKLKSTQTQLLHEQSKNDERRLHHVPYEERNLELNGKIKDWTPEDQANEKVKYYRMVLKKTQKFLEDTVLRAKHSLEDQQQLKEKLTHEEQANEKINTYKTFLTDVQKFLENESSAVQEAAKTYYSLSENAKNKYEKIHDQFNDVQKDSLLHLTKLKHKNRISKFKTKLDSIEARMIQISHMYKHVKDEKDVNHQISKVKNDIDIIENKMRSITDEYKIFAEENRYKLRACENQLTEHHMSTHNKQDKELKVCHSDIQKIIEGYSKLKQKYDTMKSEGLPLNKPQEIESFSTSESIVQKYLSYFDDVEHQIKEVHKKEELLISTLQNKFLILFKNKHLYPHQDQIQIQHYKDLVLKLTQDVQQNEECKKDKELLFMQLEKCKKEMQNDRGQYEKYKEENDFLSKKSQKYLNMHKVCSNQSIKLSNENNAIQQHLRKIKKNYGAAGKALNHCDAGYKICSENLAKKDSVMDYYKGLSSKRLKNLKTRLSDTTSQVTKAYDEMQTKIGNLRSSLRILLEKYKKIPAARNIAKEINKEMNVFGEDLNKLVIKYKNSTKNSVNAEKLEFCEHDHQHLLTNLVTTFSNLNSHLTDFRTGLLHTLIDKAKSCKQRYMYKMRNIQELQAKINLQNKSMDALENQINSFKEDYLGLSNYNNGMQSYFRNDGGVGSILSNLEIMFKGYRSMYESVYSKYQKSKHQVTYLKQKYAKEENCQNELYSLNLQLGNTKKNAYSRGKVLKRVERFYSYLLQRILRLQSGIHHLKDVGNHLRSNLVSVHSSLGHCTGTMQALRHECQGLVNWYQALPDVDRLKQNLEICQAERKKKCEDVDEMREFSNKMCSYYKKHSATCQEKLTGMVPNIKGLMAVSKTCQQGGDISSLRKDVMEDYIYGLSESVQLMNKKVNLLIEELKTCKRDQQEFHLKIEENIEKTSDDTKRSNIFPMSDRAVQESKHYLQAKPVKAEVLPDYMGEFEKISEGPQFDVGPIKALLDESEKIENQTKIDLDEKLLFSNILEQNLSEKSQQNTKDVIIEEDKISQQLKHLQHILEDKLNSSKSGRQTDISDINDIDSKLHNLSKILKAKLSTENLTENSSVIADNQLAEHLKQMRMALEEKLYVKNAPEENLNATSIEPLRNAYNKRDNGKTTIENAPLLTDNSGETVLKKVSSSRIMMASSNTNNGIGNPLHQDTNIFSMKNEGKYLTVEPTKDLTVEPTKDGGGTIGPWKVQNQQMVNEEGKVIGGESNMMQSVDFTKNSFIGTKGSENRSLNQVLESYSTTKQEFSPDSPTIDVDRIKNILNATTDY